MLCHPARLLHWKQMPLELTLETRQAHRFSLSGQRCHQGIVVFKARA